MGDRISYAAGPASIPSSGEIHFYYVHDSKGKPSMIDMVTGGFFAGGTNTGLVRFRRGNDMGSLRTFFLQSLTAAEPVGYHPGDFVLYPGQVIDIYISGATAGDSVGISIGGH